MIGPMGVKMDTFRDVIAANYAFVEQIVEDSSMFNVDGYQVGGLQLLSSHVPDYRCYSML